MLNRNISWIFGCFVSWLPSSAVEWSIMRQFAVVKRPCSTAMVKTKMKLDSELLCPKCEIVNTSSTCLVTWQGFYLVGQWPIQCIRIEYNSLIAGQILSHNKCEITTLNIFGNLFS